MLYAGILVWPMWLAPYRNIPMDLTPANPHVAWAIVVTIGLLIATLVAWRKTFPLFVGIACFAIVLSPALGPIRFMDSCVADRFLYLPAIFLLLPFAEGLRRLCLQRTQLGQIALAGMLALAIPMFVLMRAQQGVWSNTTALWSHVAEVAPDSAKAFGNLANLSLWAERFEDGLRYAVRANELEADNPHYTHVLGRALVRQGHPREAIPIIEKAIRLDLGRNEPAGYVALGEAYAALGDLSRARQAGDKAIERKWKPATVYSSLGDAALRFGKQYTVAEVFFRDALAANPEDGTVRWNLGTTLDAQGRTSDALAEYDRVIAEYRKQGKPTTDLEQAVEKRRTRMGSSATSRSAGG